MIWRAYGQPQDSSCAALTTAIEQAGLLESAKNKFLWFYDQEAKGAWTNLRVNNTIKKWIRTTLNEFYQFHPEKASVDIRKLLENLL